MVRSPFRNIPLDHGIADRQVLHGEFLRSSEAAWRIVRLVADLQIPPAAALARLGQLRPAPLLSRLRQMIASRIAAAGLETGRIRVRRMLVSAGRWLT
jgi:hypothetical protein